MEKRSDEIFEDFSSEVLTFSELSIILLAEEGFILPTVLDVESEVLASPGDEMPFLYIRADCKVSVFFLLPNTCSK